MPRIMPGHHGYRRSHRRHGGEAGGHGVYRAGYGKGDAGAEPFAIVVTGETFKFVTTQQALGLLWKALA